MKESTINCALGAAAVVLCVGISGCSSESPTGETHDSDALTAGRDEHSREVGGDKRRRGWRRVGYRPVAGRDLRCCQKGRSAGDVLRRGRQFVQRHRGEHDRRDLAGSAGRGPPVQRQRARSDDSGRSRSRHGTGSETGGDQQGFRRLDPSRGGGSGASTADPARTESTTSTCSFRHAGESRGIGRRRPDRPPVPPVTKWHVSGFGCGLSEDGGPGHPPQSRFRLRCGAPLGQGPQAPSPTCSRTLPVRPAAIRRKPSSASSRGKRWVIRRSTSRPAR